MLTNAEIKSFIDKDLQSDKKRLAKVGVDYYEGRHDILKCQIAYKDNEGVWQIAQGASDVKITHPFFNELVEQKAQYMVVILAHNHFLYVNPLIYTFRFRIPLSSLQR